MREESQLQIHVQAKSRQELHQSHPLSKDTFSGYRTRYQRSSDIGKAPDGGDERKSSKGIADVIISQPMQETLWSLQFSSFFHDSHRER